MNKKKYSLNDLVELWMNEGKYSRKPATNEKYRRIFDNHIKHDIGCCLLSVLTTEAINKYLSGLSVNGSIDGKPLSVSYIRTIAFVIKSALKYGTEKRMCRSVYVSVKLPGKVKRNINILSVEDSVALTKHLVSNLDDKKLATLLSLHLGLRIGEVCALKWSDIDFYNKTVHVQRNITRISTDDDYRRSVLSVGKVKSHSSDRIIPLPDYLFDILYNFNINGNEYIVSGSIYPYIDPRTLRNSFNTYCDDCGIPRIKFHALRHTFATRCIEFGMDVKTLSELLGHANVNITLDLYVHSTLEHKRKQLENISRFYIDNNMYETSDLFELKTL